MCSSLCHTFVVIHRQIHSTPPVPTHTHAHTQSEIGMCCVCCCVVSCIAHCKTTAYPFCFSLPHNLFILCIDTEKKWTHTIRTIEMAFHTQHTQRELNRRWSKGKWSVFEHTEFIKGKICTTRGKKSIFCSPFICARLMFDERKFSGIWWIWDNIV